MKKVLKGWIADNPVTADKSDRILLLESQGSATLADILDEMKKEDTGLRQETLEHVVNLFLRITTDLVLSGYKVNVGMFYAVAKFLGVLEGGKWNPEKNSIYVSFTQGRDLHKAIAETSVEILGEKANVMYIIETEDRKTGRKDGSATAGRNLFVRGAMLKIAGDDPSVGVTLTDADGTETKLEDDLITTNKPSELTLLLPPELEAGEYTLTVTTQFTSGVLLKTPRSVSTSIWIGGRPEEGGATVKLEVQHLHRPPPPFPLRSKDGGGRWRCCTSNLTVAKLIQRKDMSPDAEEGAKKYYGSVSATGTLGFDQICSNIAAYSTASPGDVKLVLDGLVFVASEALLRGEVVQLGELGNFQLKVSSTGTETAEEFDASMFGNPRIVFRPSIRLKTAIARVSVEKWPVITTSGSTSTDDEEERPGGL